MGDWQSVVPTSEAERHMIAATWHFLKAMEANKNLSPDFRKTLADLESHLSKMTSDAKNERVEFSDVEKRFKQAERKVLSWESNQTMIWDSGPTEATQYLEAVYEIQTLIGSSGAFPANANWRQKEILNQAESILQIAMLRLEKELIHVLVQHKECFKSKYISRIQDVVHEESLVSVQQESVEEASCTDNSEKEPEELMEDLIHAYVIPNLKSIANAMFACHYGQEFCKAFIGIQRYALGEYLALLEIEKFSIEDVLKMESNSLTSEIKKWNRALKIILRIYLASEKQFCDLILQDFGSANSFCFIEISKPTILSLLHFGEAVAMRSHELETSFCLLDMYEVLTDLLHDIDSFLLEEAGCSLTIEFHYLSKKLGDSARQTFMRFRNAIASDESSCPFPGGGIHHVTKYVMNYIMIFPEYSDTLNLLLKDQDADDPNSVVDPENVQGISPSTRCPMACHLRSITSTLESKLHEKSQLYKDDSLRHIFLMNNIHYMVQKVKDSNLRIFFGDEWIRKHNGKFQQHAKNYERATWSSVLSLLSQGRCSCSSSISKAFLKERCKSFSTAFEEVYRSQTRWFIPDTQLREDLRISTSLKVIQAYRNFIGRNAACEKYMKYTTDDLENLLLDLFEGSRRSLRNSPRR